MLWIFKEVTETSTDRLETSSTEETLDVPNLNRVSRRGSLETYEPLLSQTSSFSCNSTIDLVHDVELLRRSDGWRSH